MGFRGGEKKSGVPGAAVSGVGFKGRRRGFPKEPADELLDVDAEKSKRQHDLLPVHLQEREEEIRRSGDTGLAKSLQYVDPQAEEDQTADDREEKKLRIQGPFHGRSPEQSPGGHAVGEAESTQESHAWDRFFHCDGLVAAGGRRWGLGMGEGLPTGVIKIKDGRFHVGQRGEARRESISQQTRS